MSLISLTKLTMRLGYPIFIIEDHKSKRIPSLGKLILRLGKPILRLCCPILRLGRFQVRAQHAYIIFTSVYSWYIKDNVT